VTCKHFVLYGVKSKEIQRKNFLKIVWQTTTKPLYNNLTFCFYHFLIITAYFAFLFEYAQMKIVIFYFLFNKSKNLQTRQDICFKIIFLLFLLMPKKASKKQSMENSIFKTEIFFKTIFLFFFFLMPKKASKKDF
jgi:hypothetical protein